MFSDIVNLVMGAVTSVFGVFVSLLNSMEGSTIFIISMITVVLVARFILVPIFGSSLGSDTSKKKGNDNND